MTPELPDVNQDTKSTDNTERMELKSGIALAKMNARIQMTMRMLRRIIHVSLVQCYHTWFTDTIYKH